MNPHPSQKKVRTSNKIKEATMNPTGFQNLSIRQSQKTQRGQKSIVYFIVDCTYFNTLSYLASYKSYKNEEMGKETRLKTAIKRLALRPHSQ
jgi:hypothetical protein